MQNKESIIEDITMALVVLYSMEEDIDTLSEGFQEFLKNVEKFLKAKTMKRVWKYWFSIERYFLSLNHKDNTYWI